MRPAVEGPIGLLVELSLYDEAEVTAVLEQVAEVDTQGVTLRIGHQSDLIPVARLSFFVPKPENNRMIELSQGVLTDSLNK